MLEMHDPKYAICYGKFVLLTSCWYALTICLPLWELVRGSKRQKQHTAVVYRICIDTTIIISNKLFHSVEAFNFNSQTILEMKWAYHICHGLN